MNTTAQLTAKEILNQLGGNKFIVMTGTKVKYFDENNGNVSLTMELTRNKAKAKYLIVTLDATDTYTMEFSKFTKDYTKVVCKNVKGVYCEQLQSTFTDITGLYTSL
jgi:hypothetical protein